MKGKSHCELCTRRSGYHIKMHRSHSPPIRATSTGLFGTLQLATLVDGVLPIPPNLSVAIEIGASDRDTLDTELLASSANWFAVSLEPLVDKYARGLARRPSRKDAFQALGHHHDRGIILPFAVANVPRAGAPLTLNVGANSGCSSTLPVDLKSNRLKWCRKVMEAREVPAVPLETVLEWIGPRRVDFVKVDAQGVDLSVMESARSRISQIERFQLEVIADDCDGLYTGQPKCSAVVARAAELGFAPATDVHCNPLGGRSGELAGWRRSAWGCELEVVFLRRGVSMLPELWQYHNIAHSGCRSFVDSPAAAPVGSVVMHSANMFCRQTPHRCVPICCIHHRNGAAFTPAAGTRGCEMKQVPCDQKPNTTYACTRSMNHLTHWKRLS